MTTFVTQSQTSFHLTANPHKASFLLAFFSFVQLFTIGENYEALHDFSVCPDCQSFVDR